MYLHLKKLIVLLLATSYGVYAQQVDDKLKSEDYSKWTWEQTFERFAQILRRQPSVICTVNYKVDSLKEEHYYTLPILKYGYEIRFNVGFRNLIFTNKQDYIKDLEGKMEMIAPFNDLDHHKITVKAFKDSANIKYCSNSYNILIKTKANKKTVLVLRGVKQPEDVEYQSDENAYDFVLFLFKGSARELKNFTNLLRRMVEIAQKEKLNE